MRKISKNRNLKICLIVFRSDGDSFSLKIRFEWSVVRIPIKFMKKNQRLALNVKANVDQKGGVNKIASSHMVIEGYII